MVKAQQLACGAGASELARGVGCETPAARAQLPARKEQPGGNRHKQRNATAIEQQRAWHIKQGVDGRGWDRRRTLHNSDHQRGQQRSALGARTDMDNNLGRGGWENECGHHINGHDMAIYRPGVGIERWERWKRKPLPPLMVARKH